MDAALLLREIAGTRIGLAPSPVHGLGVFALIAIPAGACDLFAPMTAEWPAVPLAEIARLPAHVRKLIDTYCLQDAGVAYLPPNGFTIVDLVVYLNHSDAPNLRQMDGGSYFVTLRDIAAGEELLIDYGSFEVG